MAIGRDRDDDVEERTKASMMEQALFRVHAKGLHAAVRCATVHRAYVSTSPPIVL